MDTEVDVVEGGPPVRSPRTPSVSASERAQETPAEARAKRKPGRPWVHIDVEEARKLREEGLSLRAISRRVRGWDGVRHVRATPGTVARRLAELRALERRPIPG